MAEDTTSIKVFDYIPELDAFLVRAEFTTLVEELGLAEWTPVVWMGRLFARDQDFGEHWFDHWDERAALEEKAKALGIDPEQLMIVKPSAFTERTPRCIHCQYLCQYFPCPRCGKSVSVKADGPCYSNEVKKRFWTDVLKSLHVSRATLRCLQQDYTDEDQTGA